MTINLRPLPPLPSTSRQRPLVPCECGCGGTTQRRFVPGHDSRLHGWMIRVERGLIEIADIPTEGERAAVTKALAAKGKAERKAAREAAAEETGTQTAE